MSARNSFTVQFAVNVWLTSKGLTGFWGKILGAIAAYFIGEMVDAKILLIDLTVDRIKQALKDINWRDAALKAYNKASAKVYTEEEKESIRAEYLKILDSYIAF
jgi:hypothetical protein